MLLRLAVGTTKITCWRIYSVVVGFSPPRSSIFETRSSVLICPLLLKRAPTTLGHDICTRMNSLKWEAPTPAWLNICDICLTDILFEEAKRAKDWLTCLSETTAPRRLASFILIASSIRSSRAFFFRSPLARCRLNNFDRLWISIVVMAVSLTTIAMLLARVTCGKLVVATRGKASIKAIFTTFGRDNQTRSMFICFPHCRTGGHSFKNTIRCKSHDL